MARRDLRFKTLDEARVELERLRNIPIGTTGLWSYFQILTHCASALEMTIKGVEPPISWWKKHVSGPLSYWGMVRSGVFPHGIKGNPQTSPEQREDGDEKAALGRLLKSLEDFEKFEGKLSIHRRLGKLNKRQWTHFHAMHLAHHLGYAKPQGN